MPLPGQNDEESQKVPFILAQGPFNEFATLADATAAFVFKTPGLQVYIISEAAFYYWNGTSWIKEVFAGTTTDIKVKASVTDITSGFLLDKLSIDTTGSLTKLNPGGNEVLRISVNNTSSIWNADLIQDIPVDASAIANNKVLTYNSSTGHIEYQLPIIPTASQIPITPFGSVSGPDIQSALQQVQSEITHNDAAAYVTYNNIISGLLATNVQDAIDELDSQTVMSANLINEDATLGVMDGGTLSVGVGFTINITAGHGYFVQYPDVDVLQKVIWGNTSITLTANVDQYIYFNNNATLVANATEPDTIYNILLGRVVTNGTGIEFIDVTPTVSEHTSNLISSSLKDAFGPIFAAGCSVVENVTPLHLNITNGVYYFGENKFSPSGGSNVTFTLIYGQGTGVIPAQNAIDNTRYDNSGVLTLLTTSYYAKHSLYLVGEGATEKYYIVYAQQQYSTLLSAQQANIPSIPSYFRGSVVLVASIITQQGFANIVQIIDRRPGTGYRASGVNASADHTTLLNLNAGVHGDGGHINMMTIDGGKTMTGNLNIGSFNILNVSDIGLATINTIPVNNFYKQGGNTLGVNGIIGLLDNFSLQIQTGGIDRVIVSNTGIVSVANLSGSGKRLVLADATGALLTQTESAYTWYGNNSAGTTPASSNSAGALTKIDDTNITLTLGGLPGQALLNNTSLALGWTGTLSGTRGGTGVNNGTFTITLGGNFATSGSFNTILAQQFSGTITLPNATSTLATTSLIETFSNKTLDNTNSVTIKDNNLTLENSADITKQAQFSLALLSTTTTRTLNIPDANGTLIVRDGLYKALLTTTNNTVTTIINIPTIAGTGYLLELRVISKKTSGIGTGAVTDTNSYIRSVQFKNIGGVITFGAKQSTYTFEDIVSHDVIITQSGPIVMIQVLGSTNNNISWEAICDLLII